MTKKLKLSAKHRDRLKSRKPWTDKRGKPIDPDHICRCWDMYRFGEISATILQQHFPGRSINAIRSKVWQIRGRVDERRPRNGNDNQIGLFTPRLPDAN